MRAARTAAHEFAQAHQPRCPICGTRLLNDDPLGVCGGQVAHAECALIHWLAEEHVHASNRRERRLIRPEVRRELERLGLGDDDGSLAD
jgi:hypothetical protein